MFIEYWMIGVFLIVTTYFMIRFYKSGYVDGVVRSMLSGTETTLAILQEKKIIEIVKDENGQEKIVPGDYDEFIKKAEETKS
jgi:hypothetical protein